MKRKFQSHLTNKDLIYLTEGLIHKIYVRGSNILKVPKIDEFNNVEHFLIEKKCHEILRKHSLPAVQVIKIYSKKNSLFPGKCILEEPLIEGFIIDNQDLIREQRLRILDSLKKLHQIKVPNFGLINRYGIGENSSWGNYLKTSILKDRVLLDALTENIFRYLSNNLKKIPNINEGYFVILDTNSNNFIFTKDLKIKALIDVDHPISGDPLYDYAALKWHHPLSFKYSQERNTFPNQFLFNYYYLHFGLQTYCFEKKNGLNYERSIALLKNAKH